MGTTMSLTVELTRHGGIDALVIQRDGEVWTKAIERPRRSPIGVNLGLRPKQDGTYVPGWGPPIGYVFESVVLESMEEVSSVVTMPRDRYDRAMEFLRKSEQVQRRNLNSATLPPGRVPERGLNLMLAGVRILEEAGDG